MANLVTNIIIYAFQNHKLKSLKEAKEAN